MSRSHRLRLSDFRGVFRLIGEIQELRHEPAAWQKHVVDGLCELIGARHGGFVRFDGLAPEDDIQIRHVVEGGSITPEAREAWADWASRGRYREDPVLDAISRIRWPIATFRRRELVTDQEWQHCRYYCECIKPARISDTLISFFRRDDPAQADALGLHRETGDPGYTRRERRITHLFLCELYRLYREGRLNPPVPTDANLSPRQQEILQKLLDGLATKQIAYELGLSPHTIYEYIKDMYRRLGVNSRGELMARFIQPSGAFAPGAGGLGPASVEGDG